MHLGFEPLAADRGPQLMSCGFRIGLLSGKIDLVLVIRFIGTDDFDREGY